MPRGPRGERRPADVIGAAVMVARLATGEISEATNRASPAEPEVGQLELVARAKKLSAKERTAIAKKAASARWS